MIRAAIGLVGSMTRLIGDKARSALSWASDAWSNGGFFGVGGYSATDPKRQILPRGLRPVAASANELLTQSLPMLRAYCRQLERNNPTARAAIEALKAGVVGSGIGLEPDTGDANTDRRLRAAWKDFIATCSVNGTDLYALQSQALAEMVTAGEFIWRLVVLKDRAEAGRVPLAVLPLEAEWLDTIETTLGVPDASGIVWVGGVGVDKYGRPVSYKLRNPQFGIATVQETVPADQIVHGFERRRSMQARGEPWFAPVIETLCQERDLIDAELKAAVNTAAMALVITSAMQDNLDTTEVGTTDDPAQVVKLGSVARLYPGEDIKAFSHTRPSQQIAPFRQMLRGDMAAAMRCSQRLLDRDPSRANYSSMRADSQDDVKLQAPITEMIGHMTAGRLYLSALPYLCAIAGVPMPKSLKYRLLPDGQPYVDPQKDAEAALTAIAGGLTTFEAEISKRGGDAVQIWEQKAKEEALLKKLGLTLVIPGKATDNPDSDAASAPAADAKEPANG